MRALESDKGSIKAIIMLNPAPFEFHAWKNALKSIVKNVSKSTLKEWEALSEHSDRGAELFRMIYPYYTGKKNADLPIEVPLDIKACNTISAAVTDYDDRSLIQTTMIPLERIVGEKDPFFDDKEILLGQTIVIPSVGHYPFFEDPKCFSEAIRKTEKLLCQ